MKQKITHIHLATAFLAVIGCNVVLLVGYILIYPSFAGNISAENDAARSSAMIMTQSDDYENETVFSSADTEQNSQAIPENQEKIIADNTLLGNTVAGYDSAKQEAFNELAQNQQILKNRENMVSESLESYMPVQDSQENCNSIQNVQETSITSPDSQEVYSPNQNSHASLSIEQPSIASGTGIYQTDSQNNTENNSFASSGDANRFNTYNNSYLQQTTASFVINTSSGIFHIPSCRDVAKMAEKNYLKSNSSYEELSKNYKPCGHCLDKH